VNARGTRRPHPRRVRSKPVKKSWGSGGSGNKVSGCALLLILVLALPAVAALVIRA
jgi:hypothetical protein